VNALNIGEHLALPDKESEEEDVVKILQVL
jgi:hypothetical protein